MLRREIRRGGVGTRKVAGISRGCAGIHLLVGSEQSWEGSSWVNRSVWEKAEKAVQRQPMSRAPRAAERRAECGGGLEKAGSEVPNSAGEAGE